MQSVSADVWSPWLVTAMANKDNFNSLLLKSLQLLLSCSGSLSICTVKCGSLSFVAFG